MRPWSDISPLISLPLGTGPHRDHYLMGNRLIHTGLTLRCFDIMNREMSRKYFKFKRSDLAFETKRIPLAFAQD